jgi:hypothetical protein
MKIHTLFSVGLKLSLLTLGAMSLASEAGKGATLLIVGCCLDAGISRAPPVSHFFQR